MEKDFNLISESWLRCLKRGLSRTNGRPLRFAPGESLKVARDKNELLLEVFTREVHKLVQDYHLNYSLFLLIDSEGMVLETFHTSKLTSQVKKLGIKQGILLSEESAGTSAVSLSLENDEQYFVSGEEHYCQFLQNWNTIAAPLCLNCRTCGYVGLFIPRSKPLKEKHLILFELLKQSIRAELREAILSAARLRAQEIFLNCLQRDILLLSARGYAVSKISEKLHVSQSTVKYHRKRICHQLGAFNIAHATALAIKYGLLDTGEIN